MRNMKDRVVTNIIDNNVENNMLLLRDLTKEEALALLNADEGCVENIENYKNLHKGIKFLMESIENNEDIAIQIDPDADGFFSSAIAFLSIYEDLDYDNINYIINDDKNHGFQLEKIDALIKSGIKLLIIPDGGSVEIEPLKLLVENDIKVIILDHHLIEIKDELREIERNIALINNQDGQVENIYLSGCGVTYKFFKKVFELNNIIIGNKYLDLVACSLVSDVCNLKYSYENRYYLNKGSKVVNITNPFLVEICNSMKKRKIDTLTIEDIGFSIAPIINSTIRLGTLEDKNNLFNAIIGTEDFISHRGKLITYPQKARLIGTNFQKKQREYVNNNVDIVEKEIKDKKLDEDNVIFYIDKERKIEKSLRGLLCNKMLSNFEKPIMLGTEYKNSINGSARGYGDMDFKQFCEDTGLFNYLKGHDNAFGFSIDKDKISDFIDKANKYLEIKDKKIEVEKIYDTVVPRGDVLIISTYEDLWCSDIKAPLYFINNAVFKVSDIKKTGTSTYEFKNDKMSVFKYFGSKAWFEELIKGEEYITLDILAEFRKKNGTSKIIMKDCEKI